MYPPRAPRPLCRLSLRCTRVGRPRTPTKGEKGKFATGADCKGLPASRRGPVSGGRVGGGMARGQGTPPFGLRLKRRVRLANGARSPISPTSTATDCPRPHIRLSPPTSPTSPSVRGLYPRPRSVTSPSPVMSTPEAAPASRTLVVRPLPVCSRSGPGLVGDQADNPTVFLSVCQIATVGFYMVAGLVVGPCLSLSPALASFGGC